MQTSLDFLPLKAYANIAEGNARRTFRWDSESTEQAAVHCVIVGFSAAPNEKPKAIYSNGRAAEAGNINGCLNDAPNVFIESRSKPLCGAPEIGIGNKPIDGGNYLFKRKKWRLLLRKSPPPQGGLGLGTARRSL